MKKFYVLSSTTLQEAAAFLFFCAMKLVVDETCMQPGNAAIPRHVILSAGAGYWGNWC